MTVVLTLFLALAGFLAAAASVRKHHRDYFGRIPARHHVLMLRALCAALLSAALAPAAARQGLAVGTVIWFAAATVAAPAVALFLTYGPRPSARSATEPPSPGPLAEGHPL